MKKRLVRGLLFFILTVEGLLMIFGLPPFQKFDEPQHWHRAVALSLGQIFCVDGHFNIPTVLRDMGQKYQFLEVLEEDKKFSKGLLNLGERWTNHDLEAIAEIKRCDLNFLGYIPNALGIGMALPTKNPLLIFYAARIFGFLFFGLVLLWTLINTEERFYPVVWFYALMPMVVHQVTAVSYDVVVLSLILPLTSLLLKRMGGGELTKKDWLLVWGIVAVLGIIKYIYLPLILMFILMDWDWGRPVEWKRKFIIRAVVEMLALLLVVVAVFRFGKGEMFYPIFVNPKLQLRLIINDPLYFGEVMLETFREKWLVQFEEMVGVMGWRNVPMESNLLLIIFVLAVVWVGRKIGGELEMVEVWKAGMALMVFGIIIGLATVIMYLIWSVVGNGVVEGTQGRYWLPLVPFAIISCSILVNRFYRVYWLKTLLIIVIAVMGTFSIWNTLNRRYWDWSKDWVNSVVIREIPEIVDRRGMESLEAGESGGWVKESGGERVSGVVLELLNGDKSITNPYRFEVKDEACQRVIRRGYLNPWQIQYDRQTVVVFKSVIVKSKKLCLNLTPLLQGVAGYEDKLTLKSINGQPDFIWLYY